MNHIVYIVIIRPLLQIWDSISSCNWHTWLAQIPSSPRHDQLGLSLEIFLQQQIFAIKYFRHQQCFGQLNGARLLSMKSNWFTLFGFNQHKLRKSFVINSKHLHISDDVIQRPLRAWLKWLNQIITTLNGFCWFLCFCSVRLMCSGV